MQGEYNWGRKIEVGKQISKNVYMGINKPDNSIESITLVYNILRSLLYTM